MEEQVNIWHVGNTGLRNPSRIQEGFRAFSNSPFVGKLHSRDYEIGFTNFLDRNGIIQNEKGKDKTGSHGRKWRLMFAKNGFIYPQLYKKKPNPEGLGIPDEITPFGKTFLEADTLPAVQECFLRSMSVEQYAMPNGTHYFSPLRWLLAIMLELERRTGSSEISKLEFSLWGHTTDPSYDLDEVVSNILDLRTRRLRAPSKKKFDKAEILERGKHYSKKPDNFYEYSNMNMRYLRISGILQRKGKGLIIVPTKHILAEQLASSTGSKVDLVNQFKILCEGAPLPTDNKDVATALLNDMMKQMRERHILFDISDLSLDSAIEINIARLRLENILIKTDEIKYAEEQCNQWQEISDYMSLIIKGGGTKTYSDESSIEVPKDELPAYMEWVLWRAALAIDHLKNKPYEVRGFRLDSDFLPVSAAGGGKGDLYWEFDDFTILTEVTTSTASKQEAMEGEPVRRHVSDATFRYNKPVYGLFIAVRIDTNTSETFRRGIWYTKDDTMQQLNIVPMSLAQFQSYFEALFETNNADPAKLEELLIWCGRARKYLDAPAWKQYIADTISQKVVELKTGENNLTTPVVPFITMGAIVEHVTFGKGQIVAIEGVFPNCANKAVEIPYLLSLKDEVSVDKDGVTLLHERFGIGHIAAVTVVFKNYILKMAYPDSFQDGTMSMV